MYIFVVDNDADLLEMVELIFTKNSIDTTCILDAGKLNSLLEEKRPDLILMDIYMDTYDGRHICKELKNNEKYKDIPVILYSAGHIAPESIRDSEANEFLSKPFNVRQLIDKVRGYTYSV